MEEVSPQQNSELEKSRKQLLWQEEIARLEALGGPQPVDEEIKEVVVALNVNGITTLASCGGHADEKRNSGDMPWPWILVSGEQNGYGKIKALLTEFYNSRQVDEDIKLKVSSVEHGEFYLEGVQDENFAARLKQEGLSEEEKNELRVKLSQRQQEMKDFAEFLKAKFLNP